MSGGDGRRKKSLVIYHLTFLITTVPALIDSMVVYLVGFDWFNCDACWNRFQSTALITAIRLAAAQQVSTTSG